MGPSAHLKPTGSVREGWPPVRTRVGGRALGEHAGEVDLGQMLYLKVRLDVCG